MSHRLTIAPTPLLTAGDARQQLRIEFNDEDAFLDRLIARATRHCENVTKRAFVTQTWALTMDGFCDRKYVAGTCIYVPRPRLIAVSSIVYLDTAGDSQTLSSTLYRADANSEPGRIEPAYGQTWPATRGVLGDVTVTHTCGYGAASLVPDDIKHAVLLLVGHWYENREAVLVGSISKELDFSVLSLLDPYVMEVYA